MGEKRAGRERLGEEEEEEEEEAATGFLAGEKRAERVGEEEEVEEEEEEVTGFCWAVRASSSRYLGGWVGGWVGREGVV